MQRGAVGAHFVNQKEQAMTSSSKSPKARSVAMKLEAAVIPVSDIDRAKRFYVNLG